VALFLSKEKVLVNPSIAGIPSSDIKRIAAQQLPDISTFSATKQIIFSGGLNPTVGTTRSIILRKKTHISFFHWSIKGRPDAICEIQLYTVINGITRQLIRHGMPLFPWNTGQLATDEDYQDRVYNFIPPLVVQPMTANDTIVVKCDGNSDGNFCLVAYEELTA
jgi:hypothetical protein